MKNEFKISETFNASAETIYRAWLSTEGHTSMTGSPAKMNGTLNGDFTAWDGYIWGMILELQENRKIVQAWRTGEFPENAEDSHVEVLFEEANGTTKITISHSNIPEGQMENYRQGWEDFYFKPMKEYFG
ncbi:MAG: SRPBCC family protein [Anaerolineales bacterium]|nr:MAG: SRPBCC family protein [Anaerolineales bacterium]